MTRRLSYVWSASSTVDSYVSSFLKISHTKLLPRIPLPRVNRIVTLSWCLWFCYWRCQLLAASVYVTVQCPSVCLSIPSIASSSDVQPVCRSPGSSSRRCRTISADTFAASGQHQCCDPRRIDADLMLGRIACTVCKDVASCCGWGVCTVCSLQHILKTPVKQILKYIILLVCQCSSDEACTIFYSVCAMSFLF